jgi:hypothetical protein
MRARLVLASVLAFALSACIVQSKARTGSSGSPPPAPPPGGGTVVQPGGPPPPPAPPPGQPAAHHDTDHKNHGQARAAEVHERNDARKAEKAEAKAEKQEAKAEK